MFVGGLRVRGALGTSSFCPIQNLEFRLRASGLRWGVRKASVDGRDKFLVLLRVSQVLAQSSGVTLYLICQ